MIQNIKINKLIGGMLLFVAAFLSSCDDGHGIVNTSYEKGQAQLNFNFATEGIESRVSTAATADERRITSVGMMFYDENTDKYVDNTVATIGNSGGPTGSATFQIPPKVTEKTGRYKILLFTNGHLTFPDGSMDVKSYMNHHKGMDYNDMMSIVHLKYTERIKPNLPYFGETSFIYSGIEASIPTISASFKRSVAKIELQHKAVHNLHIEWAKVANYSTMGFLASDHVPQTAQNVHGSTGDAEASIPTNDFDYNNQFIKQSITSGMYCFPNIVAHAQQDDDVTTCLIIKGKYNADGWGNGVPSQAALDAVQSTYYRVNIHAAVGYPQILRRNKLYRITIGAVVGEGEPDEDGALNSPDSKLELETDDWEDPEGGDITTDPDGTYMRVYPSTLILESSEGVMGLSKIQMSEGGTWTAVVSKGNEYFEIVDDPADAPTTLRVKTKQPNSGYFAQNGEITIQGHRKNGTVSSSLVQKMVLIQLTSDLKTDMLNVDGKTGTIEVTAPGTGSILTYRVITGSQLNQWNAVADNNIASWCNFTASGGNGTTFQLEVSPNVSGNRTGSVTIHFGPTPNLPDVPAPVTIQVTQDRSTTDISVFPAYNADHPLRIDGFSAEIGNPNGCSKAIDINVYTVNDVLYPKYVAETDFNVFDAAILAQTNNSYPGSGQDGTLDSPCQPVILNSGQKLKLLVERTAPGDPTMTGTITLTPANADGEKVAGAAVYTIPVEIFTSATLARAYLTEEAKEAGETIETTVDGHVWIKVDEKTRLYVYDRNAETALIADSPVAGNFRVGDPKNNASQWQGGIWSLQQYIIDGKKDVGGGAFHYPFPERWTTLQGNYGYRNYHNLVMSRFIYSKNRVIALSDGRDASGNHVGCFFPLSTSNASGTYLAGTYYSDSWVNGFLLGTHSAAFFDQVSSTEGYIRAYRLVTQP